MGAVGITFDNKGRRRIPRHEYVGRQTGFGGIGCHGARCITGGRDGQRCCPQFRRTRNRHTQTPRFERAGGIQGLVFDIQRIHAERFAQPVRVNERGAPFAERDDIIIFPDRQHLPVSPQGRLAKFEGLFRERLPG